jgi:hypothetical protein
MDACHVPRVKEKHWRQGDSRKVYRVPSIDYTFEDRNKVGDLRGNIGAI